MSRLTRVLPPAIAALSLLAAGCSSSGTASTNVNSTVEGKDVVVSAENCPAEATTPLADGAEIVIGSSLALSGPVGAGGSVTIPAAQAVFDEVNANGGIDGHQIKFLPEDDVYEAARAVTNVKDLIDTQHVLATILQLGTAQSTAVQELHETSCTPQLYVSSGAANFYDPSAHPFSTSNFFPYAANGSLMVDFIASKFPDGAKVGELSWNNDFGETASKAFNTATEGTSVTVVAQAKHDTTAVSLTSQVTSLLDAQPDVLVASTGSSYCAQFIGAARDKGFDGPIVLPNACSDASDVLIPLGDKANNVFAGQSLASGAGDSDGAKTFQALMAERAPSIDVNSSFAALGYQVATMLVDQLTRAAESPEGLTKVSLMNAVWDTSLELGLNFPGQSTTINGEFPYPTGYASMSSWDPATKSWSDTGTAIKADGSSA